MAKANTSTTRVPQEEFASSVACQRFSLQDELVIIAEPEFIRYVGTRTQLEGEGLIPEGTKWPERFNFLFWRDSKLKYSLIRERPTGAKGPRRDFLECDNWCLRVYSGIGSDPIDAAIKRTSNELRRLRYEQSAEGRAMQCRTSELFLVARGDEKFRAFKALIPGLLPMPRTRRMSGAKANAEG